MSSCSAGACAPTVCDASVSTANCCGPTKADCCAGRADCCPLETDGCPIEAAAACWNGAAKQALREAQVEILKEKLLTAWRPVLEQAADGVLQSIDAKWKHQAAGIQAHQADLDFKAKLRALWESGCDASADA